VTEPERDPLEVAKEAAEVLHMTQHNVAITGIDQCRAWLDAMPKLLGALAAWTQDREKIAKLEAENAEQRELIEHYSAEVNLMEQTLREEP
jgi:Tfp pilus assembly protein PilN